MKFVEVTRWIHGSVEDVRDNWDGIRRSTSKDVLMLIMKYYCRRSPNISDEIIFLCLWFHVVVSAYCSWQVTTDPLIRKKVTYSSSLSKMFSNYMRSRVLLSILRTVGTMILKEVGGQSVVLFHPWSSIFTIRERARFFSMSNTGSMI